MKIVYTLARILLGIFFFIMGLNGFLLFMPPPPGGIPQHAMQFSVLLFTTHYVYLTMGAELVAGVLLLVNRFVPFALIMLAAILANILTFHVTMWPQALFPMPILALVLWFVASWPLRRHFAPLFAPVARIDDRESIAVPAR